MGRNHLVVFVPENQLPIIGANVRALRQGMGWSQRKLAVVAEDHSVHLLDHGLLGRQIPPGGQLSDCLRRPATSGALSCSGIRYHYDRFVISNSASRGAPGDYPDRSRRRPGTA
jgi:hypothetical protein